ncbi:AAA family ATPase [Laribacter hongkongensis]|uniref:AAA family ATPase n=1 Tax=Laribacter hongkongensis TaxID=168471 RepID=UPI001EFD9573|nr:AAA family ATPase [Laribacter hongkongensis]MCG9054754.1 AAA family ATPase [Laribacter hongkongensis]
MKLTRIEVQNFQGLHSARLALTTPVTLIAGRNGAGKSSLLEAVRMAMSGDPVRVARKKDCGQLVTDGHKAGMVRVEFADGRFATVALPDGKVNRHGQIVEDPDKARAALPYVLDAPLFAQAGQDARRELLFALTGCSASAEEVQQHLISRGADPARVMAVLPLLRCDFDSAEKAARTRATEAKGAWRAVTGETYGEKKAELWAPSSVPLVEETGLLAIEQELDVVDGEIAAAQQRLGAMQAERKARLDAIGQRATLEERAGRLERIRVKLAADEAELADWAARIAGATAGAGTHRNGTVHDLARALNGLIDEVQPLGIDRPAYLEALNAMDAYEREYGPPGSAAGDAAAAAAARLPEYRQSHDLMARAVANDRRDLAAAEAAAAQLAALDGWAGQEITTEDLDCQQARVTELTDRRRQLADELASLRNSQRTAAEAGRKTADAARHHADVQGWLLIADALAPGGIQAELLSRALEPVNRLLKSRSDIAGWPVVQVGTGMEITAGGRAHALLSESERWRTDVLLAIVIAELSGLRILLVDRFDVLDLGGRSELITLLDELTYDGGIAALETVIVSGTLKQAPVSLPDTMQAVWVDGGTAKTAAGKQERIAA